jgi:hypothetical protein
MSPEGRCSHRCGFFGIGCSVKVNADLKAINASGSANSTWTSSPIPSEAYVWAVDITHGTLSRLGCRYWNQQKCNANPASDNFDGTLWPEDKSQTGE